MLWYSLAMEILISGKSRGWWRGGQTSRGGWEGVEEREVEQDLNVRDITKHTFSISSLKKQTKKKNPKN